MLLRYRGGVARAFIEPDPAAAQLSDGTWAKVVASRFAGGYELDVDGTPQSHVDLEDPTHLHFEYVGRIAAVIDQLRLPGEPITAIHIGAGAMTIPRYVAHTRPGSRQQVIERELPLIELVRAHLPLPARAQIRIRIGDARDVAARLPPGLFGSADAIVSDVFAGAQAPAHVSTVEYYRTLQPLLAPDGVLIVNVADGTGLSFARRQAASLSEVFSDVAILAEVQTLKGRRFGNLVMAASAAPLPTEWLPRLMAAGPHPAKVVHGDEFTEFVRTALPMRDADAAASPKPAASVFER